MLITLNGHEVAYAYGYLANAEGIAGNEPLRHKSVDPDNEVKLIDALSHVESACKRMELTGTLDQIPRTRAILSSKTTFGEAYPHVRELRMRMHDELKRRLFLFVPSAEAAYYGKKEAFGEQVARKFAKVIIEIEEAGNCIALGRSTAAVFHLMRVMEYGVQRLGKKLGIKLAGEMVWQRILNDLKSPIGKLPEKTPREKSTKEKYAEVLSLLYVVKLAWRNPTMHPRSSYSPERAAGIYNASKSFIEHLAGVV